MSIASRNKWIVSLILGGTLLVLALIGGKWHTTYAADAGINQVPTITSISPEAVPAGRGDLTLVITGSGFGTSVDFIRVWLHDVDHDYIAAPLFVIDNGISVVITDTLMVAPDTYTIKVVKSNSLSVPTVPPDPDYDEVSNAVDFVVFTPFDIYIPIINKH